MWWRRKSDYRPTFFLLLVKAVEKNMIKKKQREDKGMLCARVGRGKEIEFDSRQS